MQTRTYSAEFGTSAGAVINASIKSGSNGFHGDVWEFLRNSKLDANPFFNNARGIPRGRFSQNQFGGRWVARSSRTKRFSSATTRIHQPQSDVGKFYSANTVDEAGKLDRTQDFAGVEGAGTERVASRAMSSRASCIDPVGVKLLGVVSGPEYSIGRAGCRENPEVGPVRRITNSNTRYPTTPIHGTFVSTITLHVEPYLRTLQRLHRGSPGSAVDPDPIAGNSNFATQYRIRGKSLVVSWTDLIRPHMLNELRGGF